MKTETFPRNGSTAGLQTYLQDINATSLLSMENEQVLAERIAARDLAARDHLDRANLRLVVNIARGYRHGKIAAGDANVLADEIANLIRNYTLRHRDMSDALLCSALTQAREAFVANEEGSCDGEEQCDVIPDDEPEAN